MAVVATCTRSSWRPPRRGCHFPWDVPALLRRCEQPEPLPLGGCILRGALTDSEQRWLYEQLYRMADHASDEIRGLRDTSTVSSMADHNPDNRPQPFVQWVHPYTRLSNAVCRPTQLLEWAEQLMHALAPDARAHVVDSMLAQLYAAGGSLLKHRDEDLSWGIGVSLGSTATFECLPAGGEARRILVRSGDVIVGEFGQMPHAVQVASGTDRARPAWWKAIDSFGTKQRCNVLFRQALSEELQRQLAEQRARELYGMDLEELRERTGKDDAFLSVHLRHASLE